jgi:hypothetical protein
MACNVNELDPGILSSAEHRQRVLRALPERLGSLWSVDPCETNVTLPAVYEERQGVAICDLDDLAYDKGFLFGE